MAYDPVQSIGGGWDKLCGDDDGVLLLKVSLWKESKADESWICISESQKDEK